MLCSVISGADIVGLNCCFDCDTALETMSLMKAGLKEAGLNPFLILQPLGYLCPDVKYTQDGHAELPEYPLGIQL